MNVFFDTNIVLEFLADRANAKQVEAVIRLCAEREWVKFLSVGSVYTIAYMTERILHDQGVVRPELTERQRLIYQNLLSSFEIVPLNADRIADGVQDNSFSDLEDSFQYQSALQAECDVLLTLNIIDFKNASQESMKIMSPRDFLNEFHVAGGIKDS